jgi:hypothetical protein
MTSNPGSTRMTSQVSHRSSRITRHVYASTDPPTSRERPKIKYFTADPRITIRRNDKTRKAGPSLLILGSAHERGYLQC